MGEIGITIRAGDRATLRASPTVHIFSTLETAMSLETLQDLLVHELKDLYSAERQLVQALPKMAKAASSDELRTAFEDHLAQTQEQVVRIETIMESFGESPKGQKCAGMEGLLEEGKNFLKEEADEDVMDAGIIASAQKVEHYEIASYGAVVEYARVLGHTEAQQLLEQTLEEEKAADELLTRLAEGGINALAENGTDDEEEETETKSEAKSETRRNAPKPRSRSRATKARN
jgi:ferritin-like metal-binding protein YciE